MKNNFHCEDSLHHDVQLSKHVFSFTKLHDSMWGTSYGEYTSDEIFHPKISWDYQAKVAVRSFLNGLCGVETVYCYYALSVSAVNEVDLGIIFWCNPCFRGSE